MLMSTRRNPKLRRGAIVESPPRRLSYPNPFRVRWRVGGNRCRRALALRGKHPTSMLRTLNPLLSGRLLTVVDAVPAGGWIAITSRRTQPRPDAVQTESSLEAVVEALLGSLALSDRAAVPLVGWIADPDDDACLDAFFAVQGIARDAERRPLEMGRLPELPDDALCGVDAVIGVDCPADAVFFLCVGQGEHVPAALFGAARQLAVSAA